MIAVNFNRAGFITDMSRIVRVARNPRAVLLAGGRAGANVLKKNFLRKERTEPNRLGGKREHFWRQLSNSVQAPVVDQPTQVSVEISDPRTRQKIEGGTITAKRVKNLAIPQTAEAYGRSPATFERETGLKLIFIKQGEGSLARIFLASRANPNSTVLQVEYVLKHSVTQKADPTALPPQAELEASVIDASQAALDRQLAQGGNQP